MVLEDFVSRPWELRRYRRPPLGPWLDGLCDWLHEQGYSHTTIREHLCEVSHFNEFVRQLGIGDCRQLERLRADRLTDRYVRKRGRQSKRVRAAAIRGLVECLTEKGMVSFVEQSPPAYQGLLDEYLDHLRRERGLAEGTIRIYRHYIVPFLESLDSSDILGSLSEVGPGKIQALFVSQTRGKADTTRGQIQAALRAFISWCAKQGYTGAHLVGAVPKVFRYKWASVPHRVDEQDQKKLLHSIDRSRPAGLRDYAIVQLLSGYGVRGAQVRALRFEDIEWRESRIRFRPCKGGKEILNPLTDEVGESLLAYLRNGRPEAPYGEVFLTDRAPFHPLRADTLYTLIASRMRRAGVGGRTLGPHAFRHAFATRMLQGSQSLKTIADLLGHRSIDSTFIYTKVDWETLRQLPLDWPEVQL